MKREVIENTNEKDFVASLIMSDKCCQILLEHVKPTYFDCDYSRVIVSWINDYYKKFKVSPKKDITSVYKMRCDEIADEALKDLVYNYLKNISESDININNEDYLVDKGKDFVDYKALQEYTENLQACLATRDMNKARKVQQDYKKVAATETNEVSLLDKDSVDIIQKALDTTEEELFKLPGAMSGVFGKIHRNDFIALLAGMKVGKCVHKDTQVLMYDGTFKRAADLVVGDKVMGPDSKPRTILSTSKGHGKMYRIHTKPNSRGKCEIDFTCNGNHILVLKNNSSEMKPISKYKKNGSLNGEYTKHSERNRLKEKEVEISVEEYLGLTREQKSYLKLFRTGVDYPEQEHKLSPRFLGMWLGDGTSSSATVTNPEKEIIEYLYEYGDSLGDTTKTYIAPHKSCPEIFYINPNNPNKSSNIRCYLKELNLLNNKHIPNEYFVDSRENRLELLAGLIDTDGYASKDSYQIQLMNKQLAEDVYRLCRELGFRTTFVEKYKHYKGMYKETDGWHYSWGVNFTGKLSEIPLLLERKKKPDSKKFSSLNNTWTFEIEEVGDDDYYGIVIDGDHRFLLGDTTVTHNTWAMQYLGLEALKQRLNVVFVSMEMTREECVQRLWKSLFGVKSGIIPEGLYETSKFVEDPCEEGKYKLELYDINVKNTEGKSVSSLQTELKALTQYSANFRIIAYPAFGASVQDITNRIEELATEGFVADVVIIDYADITKPIGGGTELRNQLDMIWKHLRGFAMKFHCCVITASQTNRSGMRSNVVGAETIGEDIRKLAHATSFVSMEQTPKMYKNHVMRLRNIAMRNGYTTGPCVFPQCLGLGQFVFGEPILAENLIMESEDDEE